MSSNESFTINPDESSKEFRSHIMDRVAMAGDRNNRIPVDVF
jgi:hypothetical protein